jgi:hypothetical protein
MPKTIPIAPIYMNPMHFETSLQFEQIEATIQQILDAYKITYTYSDKTPIFKFNDSIVTGEIRIFTDINETDYVIEVVRYKGDGFVMNNIYAKMYEILVTPMFPNKVDKVYF